MYVWGQEKKQKEKFSDWIKEFVHFSNYVLQILSHKQKRNGNIFQDMQISSSFFNVLKRQSTLISCFDVDNT